MFPKIEEVIVSAVMIEIVNRSISFLINKWWKLIAPDKEGMVDSLRHQLLRVGAIIEDSEGRWITNKAMLHQLSMMRKEFYRDHYLLDAVVCQDNNEGEKTKGHKPAGHHSFALSRFNPAKRLCICSGDESFKELSRVLGSLETALQDAAEFIMLSSRYPRISREPYNMYLLLDTCMFGRQVEMEHLLNFLLQAQAPSVDRLGVLPIIGPPSVGKSTLVEHACADERVRWNFSRIVFLTDDDLKGDHMVTLEDGGVIKYDNTSLGEGKVLIIVELNGDIDESLWQRLYSASTSHIQHGSKVIITSRSNKIVSFGTTLPLAVQYLEQEAFWYFFKVRMFGSTDVVMEHPKLASLAMDLSRELQGCFMGANIVSGMLKHNVDPRFWNLALAVRRILKKNPFLCDPHQIDHLALIKPIYIPAVKRGRILVRDICKIASTRNGSPMVTVKDLILGTAGARPQRNIYALAWKSHIPPHYSCVFKCEWIP